MNKQEIISRLWELPGEIEEQENKVITAYEMVQFTKDLVAGIEDKLILEGVIDGKNAEARAAQLREKTFTERRNIRPCENQLSIERASLNKLLNTQANYRAIAELLKAGE